MVGIEKHFNIDSDINNNLDDGFKFIKSFPTSIPLKLMSYLFQQIDGSKDVFQFKKFDLGEVKNLEKYGQKQAPFWDLSQIKVPIYMICSEIDDQSVSADVKLLIEQLNQEFLTVYWIKEEKWDHHSYFLTRDNSELLKEIDHILKR